MQNTKKYFAPTYPLDQIKQNDCINRRLQLNMSGIYWMSLSRGIWVARSRKYNLRKKRKALSVLLEKRIYFNGNHKKFGQT
jgi:hypothetical protein